MRCTTALLFFIAHTINTPILSTFVVNVTQEHHGTFLSRVFSLLLDVSWIMFLTLLHHFLVSLGSEKGWKEKDRNQAQGCQGRGSLVSGSSADLSNWW